MSLGPSFMSLNGATTVAPPITLHQAFPVVAPFSDIKLGPKDIQPGATFPKINHEEKIDDEWHHNRDRQRGQLAQEQKRTVGFKSRMIKAQREQRDAEIEVQQEIAHVEAATEERRKRGAVDLVAMKLRLDHAKELHVEAQESCRQRVEEVQAMLALEQARTADVEVLLRQEKVRSEAAAAQVEAAAAESQARLDARGREVDKERAEGEKLVESARAKAGEQVAEAELRREEAVAAARQRLAAIQETCKERLQKEACRAAKAAEEVGVRRKQVSERLELQDYSVRQHVSQAKEICEQHVQRIEDREAKTIEYVCERVLKMDDLISTCKQKSTACKQREERSLDSLAVAAHVLGHHVASSCQYNTTIDQKLSDVLGGRLHPPESGNPFASTRHLPHPRPFSRQREVPSPHGP